MTVYFRHTPLGALAILAATLVLWSGCDNEVIRYVPVYLDAETGGGSTGPARDIGAHDAVDDEDSAAPDALGSDSSADVDDATDAGPDVIDTAPDVAPDAEPDVADDVTDVAPDVTPDVSPDAAPDVSPDAAPDVSPDAAPDVSPDAAPDVPDDAPTDISDDVVVPPRCGDGIVQSGEECDDGNAVDDDACSNACVAARCGDGVINAMPGEEVFESPIVENPSGVSGYVCDDGGACPSSSCDVSEMPTAAEHGICQSLGYDRAISVTWGGGLGESTSPMPHAFNWTCFDYVCRASEHDNTADDCSEWEMLASIGCLGIVGEECDDGEDNADEPDACREDCTLPFCGDGIVDSTEECDDANDVDEDGCSNVCLLPQCGDGIPQGEEECDDGNDIDDDGCSNACIAAVCGDGIVQSASSECEVLILADSGTATTALSALLDANDVPHEVRDNGSGTHTSNLELLEDWPFVIFYNHNRAISSAEQTALDAYVTSGGRLLVTGYDSLGSPTDPTLASVLRVTTTGDGPFVTSCTVTDGDHPVTDGPFGEYAAGTGFTVGGSDHDNVRVTGTTRQIAAVGDAAKITHAADIGPGRGVVMYWNGNSGFGDWTTAGTPQNLFLNLMAGVCGGRAEDCDEGEENSEAPGAVCRTNCTFAGCGDGVLDPGEGCDDGNTIDGDGCSSTCELPFCGDGIVEVGEECDDGVDNSDTEPDACRTDCIAAGCGDGVHDTDEGCDDGDLIDDDECTNACTIPVCGDGVLHAGEECDDGNTDERDECRNDCTFSGCPDGVVHRIFGEECDDGNFVDGDECTNACLRGPLWTGPEPVEYFEEFVSGATPTAQCVAWDEFRALLVDEYSLVSLTGSLEPLGLSCSDPEAATAIALALRTSTDVDVMCDGHRWTNCGARYLGELWIDPPSLCASSNCPSPGYIVRPCISNSNWGGVNTATCSPPSQTMTLRFE